MAKTSFIVACALLLLMISLTIRVSDGRHIKLREENEDLKKHAAVDSDQLLAPEAPPQVVNSAQPPPPPSGHVDNFRPTNPGHSPGAGHSLQLQTSSVHLVRDASTTLDHNNSHYLADQRTHKSVSNDGVVPEAPSPVSDATVLPLPPPTKRADDFKPTVPGHSPGAGHSIQN